MSNFWIFIILAIELIALVTLLYLMFTDDGTTKRKKKPKQTLKQNAKIQ